MKRFVASFAVLGLLAGPAVAATSMAASTTPAKHMKKNAKLAQKTTAHNAKPAAAPKTN